MRKESALEFLTLFNELEKHKELLGINSYAIVQTTLEDVFLRMVLDEVEKAEKVVDQPNEIELHSMVKGKEKAVGALANETPRRHFRQQLYALFVKRALVYRRDIGGMIFTLIIPVAVVAVIATISKIEACILFTQIFPL